jgi:dienelactone hydrolase
VAAWLRPLALALFLPLGLGGPATAEPSSPRLVEALPPPALRTAWVAAGRPTVVLVPDHLGLDARAGFHAAPMLARGLAVVMLDLPPAPGLDPGDWLRPRPPSQPEAAPALLPGLFALLHQLAGEGLPPEAGPRRAVGLLGFGAGGEAALLAAEASLAPAAPRFSAHAALYPTCDSQALRTARSAAAPATGAPILIILPHAGRAGELPGGCAPLFDPAGPPSADRVLLRAYDSLGYAFDLWPAIARQGRHPGRQGFDPLRFDALRAELARQELAGFFAESLAAPAALRAGRQP